MMAWVLCACKKKTIATIKFQVGTQGDFEQEVVRVWLWNFKKKGVELVVELSKNGLIGPLFKVLKWSSYLLV
jgi:hypothetical protein